MRYVSLILLLSQLFVACEKAERHVAAEVINSSTDSSEEQFYGFPDAQEQIQQNWANYKLSGAFGDGLILSFDVDSVSLQVIGDKLDWRYVGTMSAFPAVKPPLPNFTRVNNTTWKYVRQGSEAGADSLYVDFALPGLPYDLTIRGYGHTLTDPDVPRVEGYHFTIIDSTATPRWN